MDGQDKFKDLLKTLAPFLKGHGYTRRGQTFRTRRDSNWGVINFQRGRYAELKFTVNLGVYLQTLSDVWPQWEEDAPPPESACHWRERIGSLLPGGLDKWWLIDENTELATLIEELKAALSLAVAEIAKYLKDEDFRDYLLAGGGTGFTRYHSRMCLFILVSKYGPRDMLSSILAELKANAHTDFLKQNMEEQIRKLGPNTDE